MTKKTKQDSLEAFFQEDREIEQRTSGGLFDPSKLEDPPESSEPVIFEDWLVDPKNPTDRKIAEYSTLPPEGYPEYSPDWIEKMAVQCRNSGYITLYDVVFILAGDEQYSDILPKLWEKSNLDIIGKYDQSIAETVQGRAYVWYWLLCRWTMSDPYIDPMGQKIESEFFGRLPRLKFYQLDLYIKDGELIPVKHSQEKSPLQYVKLDAIRDVFGLIRSPGNDKAALPKMLFPDAGDQDETIKTRSEENSIAQKFHLSLEVIELIKKAVDPTEKLYKAMTDKVGVTPRDEKHDIQADWKHDLMQYLDGCTEEDIAPLTRDLFEEDPWNLYYSLTRTKERDSFRYKIIQRLIKKCYPGMRKLGKRTVLNIYKNYVSV